MKRNDFYKISSNVDELIKAGKINDAIDAVKREFDADPENPVYYSLLGELYEDVDFNQSVHYYEMGLHKFRDNPYLLIGLGFIYYNIGNFEKAREYFQEAWLNDPSNIKLITAIGNIFRNLKNYDKALKYYELAKLVDPKNIFALFGLADCYRGLNHHERALSTWLQLHEIEPGNKIFITRIGDSYRLLRNYTSAIEFYDKALTIDYDFYAELGKALCYEQTGDENKSFELFRELERKESGNSRFYYEYLKFLIRNRQFETVRKLWEICQKKFPGNRYLSSLQDKIFNEGH